MVSVEEEIIRLCNMAGLTNRQCEAILDNIHYLCEVLAEELKLERKSRRKRSEYQEFISECLREEIPKQGDAREAMRICARRWRESKS